MSVGSKVTDRTTRAACIALLIGAAGLANAGNEALYVIEQLIISVSAESDGSGERVASIRSGDRVEVLERQGEYVRVKLRTGPEGWVKASYLSSDPPLRERFDAQTQALEQARAQVTKLEAELAQARDAAAAEQPAAPIPSDPSLTMTAAQVQEQPVSTAVTSDAPMLSPRPPLHTAIWPWALGSSTVALIAGFVLGWRMLDRRIRRKYGGLRIY